MFALSLRSLVRLSVLSVAVLAADSASAQILKFGPDGHISVAPGSISVTPPVRIGRPISQPRPIYGPRPIHQPWQSHRPVRPITTPYYPDYNGHSNPHIVTPDRYAGINPQTGGIDTRNEQINDTAFMGGREQSKYNGTKRWVRRPVYRNGRVVGYEEGWVWNNSYNGQEHADVKIVTPNDKGGVHEQVQARSMMQ